MASAAAAAAAAGSYHRFQPKCRDHPYEIGPGICASCLRLRLFSLLSSPSSSPAPSPLYHHQYPLFYSTPQITSTTRSKNKKKKYYFLPSFFRPRQKKPTNPQMHLVDPPYLYDPPPPTGGPHRLPSSSSSSSWISSLLGRSRGPPATSADYENFHSCPSVGYTPSPAWRLAAPTPARRSSGAAAWLSPLWGRPPHRAEPSGDSWGSYHRRRRHGSDVASAGALVGHCRSRKLADIGRFS